MIITFSEIQTRKTGRKKKGLEIREVVLPISVYINGHLLTVIPAGFQSDGTSIPWFARLTWDDPWHPRYQGPALLHDWMLLDKTQWPKKWQVDWYYEGALRSNNVSALETWLFTNGVRTRRSRK